LEQDGVYTVRSAYNYYVNSVESQDNAGIAGNWQQIWRAKIPPRVKNLLWRIGRNVLPTRVRLNSRGIQCPENCAICNDGVEDSIHVLFLCPHNMACWQQEGLWNHINAGLNTSNNIAYILLSILHNLNQEQQANFSVLLWSIWKRRNNKVWNNISETNTTVCERARHFITSWKQAQQIRSSANISQPIQQHIHWEKPSRGRYKCNIDASFSHTRNKVGIGMCIRDDHGRYVAAKTEWLSPILDVEIGEAMGLLSALKWVDELQLRDIDFEMDCKRVVDCLHSSRTYNSELGDILRDCRFILTTSLVNSHVKFIRRQANEVAHRLAREATSLASFHIFINIPTCIYDIILNEMR
jgi:ribonuclease HI